MIDGMSVSPPILHPSPSRASARLAPARLGLIALALLIILLAWTQVLAARRGLVSRRLAGEGGTPLHFLAPEGATGAPGVVVAHGFSGSSQFMLGFGHVLARAGYGVMLLDFDGHGSAAGVLDQSGGGLQRNLDAAYAMLAAQPEVDPARIALLGHSMGSGAVMQAGIVHGERYAATVAVSPTGAGVSPERPRNLLLIAGSLEPRFLDNAWALLAAAGGANDDLAGGRGRALITIPRVEHITILFSGDSHQAALDWLNRTFGRPPQTAAPDRRVLWYAAHLGGWLLLMLAAAPLLPVGDAPAAAGRRRWRWLGLPLGVLAATMLVATLGRLADIGQLGGMLVGGVLGLWFAVLGLVWLLAGFRVPRPGGRDLLWGLALFAALTVAFGLMAQFVWIPWLLIPARLARWPLLALAALPWLLAAGLAQQGSSLMGRAGWWLFQMVVIVAGLGLLATVSPGVGFIVLLMPVIPVILAVMSIAGAVIHRPWSYAIGNALFFGWLLVAVFPLA